MKVDAYVVKKSLIKQFDKSERYFSVYSAIYTVKYALSCNCLFKGVFKFKKH